MLAGVGELSGGGSSSLGPGYNESQWSAAAPGMQQPISQCVITQSNATVCTPAQPSVETRGADLWLQSPPNYTLVLLARPLLSSHSKLAPSSPQVGTKT